MSARSRLKRFLMALVTVSSIALLMPTTSLAQTSDSPVEIEGLDPRQIIAVEDLPADGYFAPAPASEIGGTPWRSSTLAGQVQAFGLEAAITAGDCSYDQRVDRAHSSGNDVSTHGWWVRTGGTCPRLANVDTYLQAYWCDSWFGCRWVTVDSDSRDVRQGGGRGKRGNARKTCATFNSAGWRSFVDVDLIGVSDPSGYTYSDPRDLNCTPS